jgi:hypothetical protein
MTSWVLSLFCLIFNITISLTCASYRVDPIPATRTYYVRPIKTKLYVIDNPNETQAKLQENIAFGERMLNKNIYGRVHHNIFLTCISLGSYGRFENKECSLRVLITERRKYAFKL